MDKATVMFSSWQIYQELHFRFQHGPGVGYVLVSLGVEHAFDKFNVAFVEDFFLREDCLNLGELISVILLSFNKGAFSVLLRGENCGALVVCRARDKRLSNPELDEALIVEPLFTPTLLEELRSTYVDYHVGSVDSILSPGGG